MAPPAAPSPAPSTAPSAPGLAMRSARSPPVVQSRDAVDEATGVGATVGGAAAVSAAAGTMRGVIGAAAYRFGAGLTRTNGGRGGVGGDATGSAVPSDATTGGRIR